MIHLSQAESRKISSQSNSEISVGKQRKWLLGISRSLQRPEIRRVASQHGAICKWLFSIRLSAVMAAFDILDINLTLEAERQPAFNGFSPELLLAKWEIQY